MNKKQIIAQYDADMRKAEREIEALRIRLDTLREYRAKLARPDGNGVVSAASHSGEALPGPGKAIRRLLADRPGLDQEAIVGQLKGKIKTASKNEERLIRNTVLNMLRDSTLRKDENGGLQLN